jgi:transposase
MSFDHERDCPSRWATLVSIAEKIGCVPQTLHEWVKKAEVDSGERAGVPAEVADKVKALASEVRKLRKASAYFAQAELDRLFRR